MFTPVQSTLKQMHVARYTIIAFTFESLHIQNYTVELPTSLPTKVVSISAGPTPHERETQILQVVSSH